MDNVKMYIDGSLVASTTTNHVSYVAMENTATPLWIGALDSGGSTPAYNMKGDIALTGIDGSVWSVKSIWRFHQLCKGLYGI